MSDTIMKETKMIKRLLVVCTAMLVLTGCHIKGEDWKMDKFFFEYNGVRFCVGEDSNGMIGRLGDYNSVKRAPSCAGIGEDIIYVYNGFRISAYAEDGTERIVAIEITNDAVSTPEGISLGDRESAVMSIYGVPEWRSEDRIEYESGGVKLRFTMSERSVSSIRYSISED